MTARDRNLLVLLWAIIGLVLVALDPPWWVAAIHLLGLGLLVVLAEEPRP